MARGSQAFPEPLHPGSSRIVLRETNPISYTMGPKLEINLANPMKRLWLTLVVFSAIILPAARSTAQLPYLTALRNEVLNQLTLATNGVPEPDKQLVSTLQKALATIDKTQPTYAAGAKALGKVGKGLNGTGVSNAFFAVFQSTVLDYVSALTGEEDTLAARLAATFPSKSKTSGQLALERLLAALQGANATDDIVAAAGFLRTAAKEFGTATKLTIKAEDAPPPPANITANITGATTLSINTQGAGVTAGSPGNFALLGAQAILNPPGQRGISFSLSGVTEGTHTVALSNGTITIQSGFSASAYTEGTGTGDVTLNSAARSIFGTFTFTANGSGGTVGTVTVTGSFTGSY